MSCSGVCQRFNISGDGLVVAMDIDNLGNGLGYSDEEAMETCEKVTGRKAVIESTDRRPVGAVLLAALSQDISMPNRGKQVISASVVRRKSTRVIMIKARLLLISPATNSPRPNRMAVGACRRWPMKRAPLFVTALCRGWSCRVTGYLPISFAKSATSATVNPVRFAIS